MVFGKALAQAIETFGDGLARKSRQCLGSFIDLDTGDHARLGEIGGKRDPVLGLLADGLVIHDDAADVVLGARRGEQHLAVGPPVLLRGLQFDGVKALFDGAGAFVGSQNPSIFRDHGARDSV
jgi:hypothetical protein